MLVRFSGCCVVLIGYIFFLGSGTVILQNCNLTRNAAKELGGAIAIESELFCVENRFFIFFAQILITSSYRRLFLREIRRELWGEDCLWMARLLSL